MKIGTDIDEAARHLRAGRLVAFATETVYGLGADATQDDAVRAVFAAKGRPANHPLIVHAASREAALACGRDVPRVAHQLAEQFWPGPLTMILHRAAHISKVATGGVDTVAVRVPAHDMARALIARVGLVVAPSANRFGHVSPTTAQHVAADLDDAVAYVLDGGSAQVGVESTIVDLTGAAPVVLRPGGVSRAQLVTSLGALGANEHAHAPAPGTLASHYAPRARVLLATESTVAAAVVAAQPQGSVGVMGPLSMPWPSAGVHAVLPDDAPGYAQRLYATLRALDAQGVATIVAVPPATRDGMGEAIWDRLQRAAHEGETT